MRDSIVALKNKRQERGQHAGLLLQRYLTENATGNAGNPEEKQAILRAAIAAASNPEVRELYSAAYERWKTSVDASTVQNLLQVSGRLIVGLGSENVLETGIRLHHTYGMPLIPGSALKGLAAHYCDQVWGQRDLDTPSDSAVKFRSPRPEVRKENRSAEKQGDYHALLFGNADEIGCIVFHDGWLKPDPDQEPLKLDVMTPHHPKWLDGSVPPTDFDSPIPVPFLSVVGTFQIAVSWNGPSTDQSQKWTQLAYDLGAEALSKWGIGGKTTSGYGRLDVPPLPPPPLPFRGNAGELVDAELLEVRTKKGGWKARIRSHSQVGPIQNSDLVPSDAKAGDLVTLELASINDREAAFKWPLQSMK